MRTITFILSLLSLLLATESNAQYIRSVSLQTIMPTNHLELIADVTTPSSPGFRISYTSQLRNDTLYLTACYFSGIMGTTHQVMDTFQLAPLNTGNYTLFFKVILSNNQFQCNPGQSTSFTKTFNIGAPLGIKSTSLIKDTKIFPNPANTLIKLEGEPIQKLTIYDLSGKVVLYQVAAGNPIEFMDISFLPKGLYIVEITGRQRNVRQERLLKI